MNEDVEGRQLPKNDVGDGWNPQYRASYSIYIMYQNQTWCTDASGATSSQGYNWSCSRSDKDLRRLHFLKQRMLRWLSTIRPASRHDTRARRLRSWLAWLCTRRRFVSFSVVCFSYRWKILCATSSSCKWASLTCSASELRASWSKIGRF